MGNTWPGIIWHKMIALLGPPPKDLIMREHRMRSWNFAPAIENDENNLCHKAYEFYHGPFFDGDGNSRNRPGLLIIYELTLVCVHREVFVS